MKREIKFRGRSKLNGKWAYGAVIQRGDDWCSIIVNNPEYGDLNHNEVRVITETTGQYIGLKDKNEKDIFEGDIILGASFEPLIVGFCEESSSFGACKNKSMIILQMYWFYNDIDIEKDAWEVIGNIYENPDLISNL